jgi:hypothetical protein
LIFIHPNFPALAAFMLRALEKGRQQPLSLMMPTEIYGTNDGPNEWLACVKKWSETERSTILTLDSGIKENAVTRASIRESGCNFLTFARRWQKTPWEEFAWRLVKYWPAVTGEVIAAESSGQHCKLEVAISGRVTRFNL